MVLLLITTMYAEKVVSNKFAFNSASKSSIVSKSIKSQTRIINGVQVSTDSSQWEFIGALKYEGEQYCGGSLIAPNWLLTAAHCLHNYVPNMLDTVGVGNYDINYTTDQSIKRFIVHPKYDPITVDNDIALIELQNNVTNITPIVYDTSHSLVAGTPTEIAGWGNMSITSEDYPTNLMEVLVPIVDFDTCNSLYDGGVTSNMICAGYLDGGKDSCQGDSGGPLTVDKTLVGIISWGEGCAQENYPGVYTKVQNYDDWIKQAQAYTQILTKTDNVGSQAFKYYKVSASQGQSLNVTLSNLSADVDLYIKAGSNPTTTSYDCRSWNSDTTFGEACPISSDGDIYIGVYGYVAGSYDLEVISMGPDNKWLIMPVMDGMNIPIPYK